MGWRNIIITKECKISLRMEHLIVKTEKIIEIPLLDIDTLIIENPSSLITGHLLNALTDNKITVIICGENHNPKTNVLSIYGHHRQSKKIKEQSIDTMQTPVFTFTLDPSPGFFDGT